MATHDLPKILGAIVEGYRLPQRGHHGVTHWARVMQNGLRIAETNGADTEVVKLFALFHDSRRINEHVDNGHGQRGGDFARTLRGSLVHLDDRRFELLYEACRLHTDGLTEAVPTIQACWDADRLDLGRVGITPHKRLLGTEEAQSMMYWAHNRAVTRHVATEVLSSWGIIGV